MTRVLAIVVAIGMVAGALYIRGRIDDDGGDGGGANGDGGNGQLVCDAVLAEACRAVRDDVVVDDAAATAERLLTADRAGFEWVTPGPWPAMVDALRSSQGRPALFGDDSTVVASSPLGVVGPPDSPGAWREVGDAVGAGGLRLGWRDPDTGLGVLQVGAFAVGFFDGPDFASNDFDDPAFTGYLEGIDAEAEQAADPLERRLQQGISFADAVLSFEAEAVPLLDAAAPGRRGDLRPQYPEPVVAVEAVLAGGDDLAEDLSTELLERGWAQGRPANLPGPGVLAALWQEVSG